MSVTMECIAKYSKANLPLLNSTRYKFLAGSDESGVNGKTQALENNKNQRIKDFDLRDAGEEVVSACVADKEGFGPKIFRAWKTMDNKGHMLMQDYKLGSLRHFIKYRRPTPKQYSELDDSLVELYRSAFNGHVCHRDLHIENIAVRLHYGKIQAKAIDFGMADINGQCAHTDFVGLVSNLWYMNEAPLDNLPKLSAIFETDIASWGARPVYAATTVVDGSPIVID